MRSMASELEKLVSLSGLATTHSRLIPMLERKRAHGH